MYDLTVIIPTYNEENNIEFIVDAVNKMFNRNKLNGEILIVDDNSSDLTHDILSKMGKELPNLNVIIRLENRGLSQSVVEGFKNAYSNIFVVIDADFSHPVNLIPSMYEDINKFGFDIVVGSRYMEEVNGNSGIGNWPLQRKILSYGATFLGRIMFPYSTDPVSGFFAVHKDVVNGAPLKPRGYKILLEILGKGNVKNKYKHYTEIPYIFNDRENGVSKLSLKVIIEYIEQVVDNAKFILKNK
jgi:dolichol-phosphate mannosyltransferase